VKIVVAVKQVAQLDDEFELRADGSGVDADFLDYELNEWDSFSVEEALSILEGVDGDGEVVVVSVGDEESEEGIRTCLAMGADRGVRVWDPSLEGADALAVARVLAAAAEREHPDLVLCGVQSSDAVYGATGIAMAAHLGWPHVAVVTDLEYDPSAPSATVDRELEGGLKQRVRVRCPALITVQTGINEPRYANLRAIKQAKEKPLDELGLADLELDADAVSQAAGARMRQMTTPERGEGAEMLEGTPAEVAQRIAGIIEEKLG
jgi:electron transfer flavoprotein beta subunit